MNRISRRASAVLLLALVLVGGLCFFLYEYAVNAETWIVSAGSPHVYNNTNIGCGTVVDRNGELLLDMTEGRAYSGDYETRLSTLHWLGDRKGQISAPAIAHYALQMTGFDPVSGLYAYGENGGVAELTLSAAVQNAALRAMDGRKGTVAVYNYKTGEILCAITTPTFDPDDPPDIAGDESGAYEGLYLNRFTQSVYIPGSTFKIVTTAAALSCVGDILDRSFTCTGVREFGIDRVTCEKAHGTLTLKDAMMRSCNCAFSEIAQLVGKENLEKYVRQFGVVAPVSFDGITTAAGNFDIADAAPVQLAWAAIGQHTDQVNPCSYLTFLGAIANGGQGALPHVVARVISSGTETYTAQTAEGERIMPGEIAQTLQAYMRNNVVSNYGADNFPGLTVCAKSGTSQLGGGQVSNAMFAGFVLDEKYPLAFFAAVENGGYGSRTCVPVVAAVLEACKAELDAQG